MKNKKLKFVDIFSGAGGLSCGLEQAGMECLLGVDCDKYAAQTFEKNHKKAKVYSGEIEKLTKLKLNELLQGQTIDAVVGGPPCQGFSTVGLGDPKDKRNSLFLHFVRIVKLLNPNFIVIENVTGLVAKKNEKTLLSIFHRFQKLGYNLDIRILSSQNFGVPEVRRRTIILGTRINSEPIFPKPTHDIKKKGQYIPAVTIGEAFEDLATPKGELLNHDLDSAKVKNKLDENRLKRIPEGRGIRYQKDELAYLPPKLRFNVDWENLPEGRFRQTKYQRLDRNKPGPTIMTHRHGYFHPTENRYLTPREAAKCQSFPNDFEFIGPISAQWRQIGNAVPPLLGKAIGKCLLQMAKKATDPNNEIKKVKKKDLIIQSRKKAFNYRDQVSL